ncbi:MAG: ABC transporter substrate-binding protein [Deltaproteobacteria bacterium]|nr:ABC transporter substrate-binding protein [Deltaproteobacteria bacterium]
MKKRILCVVLAFTLVMVFGPIGQSLAGKEYKIGALFSVTGRASFLGEPERNTAKMIEEMTKSKGGINGIPIRLIIYDTEGNETKTVNAANKLIKKDKVLAIIGPSTSGTSMAVIPIVTRARVPMISSAASKRIASPVERRKWIFKVVPGDDLAVELMCGFMRKKGIRKVAIMSVSTGYGISGRSELKRLAPKTGIEIVADETYGPKDTDLSAVLTKIRGTEAEAIINWSIGPTQIIATRNWKHLGMQIPLYQSYGFGSKRNIQLSAGAAEGVICPVSRIVVADKLSPNDPQAAVVRKYKSLYETKFRSEVSVFGGHAWDSMYQLLGALKHVGANRSKIRDYLENIKGFVGQNGIFNRSPQDHVGLTKDSYVMVQVKNGDWMIIE